MNPAFDRTSGQGTLTTGNSSPLFDGAAAIWVASDEGLFRLPVATLCVRLVDVEAAAVDILREGLLLGSDRQEELDEVLLLRAAQVEAEEVVVVVDDV